MPGWVGGGPGEGRAGGGGTKESVRDTLEVRASAGRPTWAFLDFKKTVLGGHAEGQIEQRL